MKTALCIATLAPFFLVCGDATAASLSVQVNDSSGKPLADVVVVAEPDAGVAIPKHLKPGEIEQRGLKFLPLVSVIQTGSRIAFPNNDKVKHHIYSFSPAKKFDQKLYSGVAAAPQVFDKAGLVVLGCNIHDRMLAYVKVVDSPYFAKTDAAGVARIVLPDGAGKYSVSAWHYNMSGTGSDQALLLKAGDAPSAITFKLALKPPVAEPAASEY
ncbi:MAG: methylamine utilization protein [Pseudomonadota bacterium]